MITHRLLFKTLTPVLLHLHGILNDQFDRYRRLSAKGMSTGGPRALMHKQILETALARDADKAGQLARAVEKFREAEEIYRDLRMTSELHGHRRMAGEFFFREMLMRHYRLPRFSAVRWVSRFAHIIYGYGERPAQ